MLARRGSRPGRVPAVLAALLVLLALAAAAGRGAGGDTGGGSAGLPTPVLDGLLWGGLAVLVGLVALAQLQPGLTRLEKAVLLALLALSVAWSLHVLTSTPSALSPPRAAPAHPGGTASPPAAFSPEAAPTAAPAPPPPSASPADGPGTTAVTVSALAAAVALAGALLLLRSGRRARVAAGAVAPAGRGEPAAPPSLEAVERESDPRRAVVAAYVRAVADLAAAGVPRLAAESPWELVARAGAVTGDATPSLRRLTGLFERARFSEHPVDAGMRVAALTALRDLHARLVTPAPG